MRGYKVIISGLLLITLVLFSGACDKDDDGDKDITSLVSVSVSSGPTLDGSGNDAFGTMQMHLLSLQESQQTMLTHLERSM